MSPALLFLALQAASAPPKPELIAAQDYAHCIGLAAVLGSATNPSIDKAIDSAFEQCAPKRAVALAAIATAFKAGGLDEASAAREAEETLHDNDVSMANKLKLDITAFRRTGQVPDAPNR